jgi:VWFA-related protein
MVYGLKTWAAAGLVAVSATVLTLAAQPVPQQPAPQQQTTSQQQQIPDAPRPQTLPTLRTLTPTSAALPDSPAPQADSTNAQQTTPGSTLPSAPKAQSPEDTAPEIPAAGQGAKVTAELEGTTPPPPPGKSAISVNVYFVEVPFTVKDSKGQLVPGIPARDVRVYENGLRQQMRIYTEDPFPLSVALVIDQSVTFDVMDKVNRALDAIQGAFTPYDEVSVFTYNNGVREQTVPTAAQSARLAAVINQSKKTGRDADMSGPGPLSHGPVINGQVIPTAENNGMGGTTMNTNYPQREYHTLNDAILAAATEVAKSARGRRRIVYVISDGKEYGSKAKEKDVIKYCQMNKVSVWATVVGTTAVPGLGFLDRIHLPLTMRDDVLPRFAAATGGQVDPEFRQKGIEASFAKITQEVRNQYTVGYYSHEPILDGKYRKVEVRVARPNLTVIAKEGYYPSLSDSRPSAPAAPAGTTLPAAKP